MQVSRAVRRLGAVAVPRAVPAPRLARGFAGGGHGHGHAKPQYTGFEAKVRAIFPENYHLVYGVLGMYAVLIGVTQVRGSFKKSATLEAAPAPEKPDYHTEIPKSSDLPEFGTPEWEQFIAGGEENIKKLIEAAENIGQGAAATH